MVVPGPLAGEAGLAPKDARALDLRRRGLTYAQIAENLGFASTNASFQSVKRAIKDLYQEDTEGQTTLELERLDDMLRVLVRVALSRHRAVASNGRLILDEQGNPVYDDATNVQAALAVVKLSESRRKLLGLDAPAKSRVQVITDDDVDAEIKALTAELAKNDDHADTSVA
ncbi:MAG: hypothetical protein ACTHKL_16100 [Streptosporangiaceae bacterium]